MNLIFYLDVSMNYEIGYCVFLFYRRTPTPNMSTDRSSNTLTSPIRSSSHVPSELSRDFFDKKMKQKNLTNSTNDTKQTPQVSLTLSGGLSQKKLAMKT